MNTPTPVALTAGDVTPIERLRAHFSEAPEALQLFAQLVLDGPTGPALAGRPVAEAIAAIETFWAQALEPRLPGTDAVNNLAFSAPAIEPVEPGPLRLMTRTEDRPHLVEAVLAALRDAGATVGRFLHPVVEISRDAAGAATEVGHGPAESMILVEYTLAPGVDGAAMVEPVRQALADSRLVADDTPGMRARMALLMAEAETRTGRQPELTETIDFLMWMNPRRFVCLGLSETELRRNTNGEPIGQVDVPETAMGLMRPGHRLADFDAVLAPRAELDRYAGSRRPVVFLKANVALSRAQPELLDVVIVRRFDAAGDVTGTSRFIGLFTAEMYFERPDQIPILRQKVAAVLARVGGGRDSFAQRQTRDVLFELPRDELFQSSEQELAATVAMVAELRATQKMAVRVRRDRYGRFHSVLVYLPRGLYSGSVRRTIEAELRQLAPGVETDTRTEFLRDGLVRLQVVLHATPGTTLEPDPAAIAARLEERVGSWRGRLAERLADTPGLAPWAEAFPAAYRETFGPADAEADVRLLARLPADGGLAAHLTAHHLRLVSAALPALSDTLPRLERAGLRVLTGEAHPLRLPDRPERWLQVFALAAEVDTRQAPAFEALLAAVATGRAEDDAFNGLALTAGLGVREIALVRAFCRYLVQTRLPFDLAFMAARLGAHADFAGRLVAAFLAAFDPDTDGTEGGSDGLDTWLAAARLTADEERFFAALISVLRATLRTNYFQREDNGAPRARLVFKLDPSRIPEVPMPRPAFEIWVSAPEVEGVHLRGGAVARGGLRWSDRPADFRTEVLGLMRTQQVKNAIIVPVGAKGGFVLRGRLAEGGDRRAAATEGYKTFVRGLLDVTDNLAPDGTVVPPPRVRRRDGDDPYLVVAADKGTATFSDTANALAAERGFWLGDAFASGGSAGYDHKAMGITAKGAWESVKEHGRGMNLDVQAQDFTVAGIGDMSGDVFGNGMLLSPHIRLVAAFDHRHIFLDPDPDAARTFPERQRMFALPSSSWADYDAGLISPGGGVFPRGARQIPLSAAARTALGVDAEHASGTELVSMILRAPVDLLWNGGIGTYVKAASQSQADAADRANDAVRVDARELRARMVGEGGNLGFTQAARVEYAEAGGRINTDAIDNAGGVHCSDREVNIKIALNPLLADHRLSREVRDPLLAAMTDDVARAVIAENRRQAVVITQISAVAAERLDEHAGLIRRLERAGRLARRLEGLPSDDTLAERGRLGRGLTRPEISVLLAFAKIELYDALRDSTVPDDPWCERIFLAYFPPALVDGYRAALDAHRLKREIIATQLANHAVDSMGAAFFGRAAEEQNRPLAELVRAFVAAEALMPRFDENPGNPVPDADGKALGEARGAWLRRVTLRLAETGHGARELAETLDSYAPAVSDMARDLAGWLPGSLVEALVPERARLEAAGVPGPTAAALVLWPWLAVAPDMADIAREGRVSLEIATRAYFGSGEALGLPALAEALHALHVEGRWPALARKQLQADLADAWKALTLRALARGDGADPGIAGARARLDDLKPAWRSFEGLSVAVRELQRLVASG